VFGVYEEPSSKTEGVHMGPHKKNQFSRKKVKMIWIAFKLLMKTISQNETEKVISLRKYLY
jgi:hypothetical protein